MNALFDVLYWHKLSLRCWLTGSPTVQEFMAQAQASVMQSMGLTAHDVLYSIVEGKLVQVYPAPPAPTQAPKKKPAPKLTLVSSKQD